MGSNRYNEDAEAISNHNKIEKIRKIKNDTSDWDRKTPKSEDEQAHEDSENLRIYNETFGDK